MSSSPKATPSTPPHGAPPGKSGPSWFAKHHKALFVGIGVSIMVVAIVITILWLMGVGPFKKVMPVYDVNQDERVLLAVYNKRRAAQDLPPVTELPETKFDPNGFHGAWAAPPLEIDDPDTYQEMCTPCWRSNPGGDPYEGSFQHGMGTVSQDVIIANCRYPGESNGQAAFNAWQLQLGGNNEQALKSCWNSVCLPTNPNQNGCEANFFKTTSSGAIVGQGWGTLGDSTWIQKIKSIIGKLCPEKQGLAASKQTTKEFGGVQVPQIQGASAFMQNAFNQCFSTASKEGVPTPTSLCTNIVLQNAAKLPSSISVSAAEDKSVDWFGEWKENWNKVLAQRKAQGEAQTYCDEEGADPSTCCPTTTTHDASLLRPGCCMLPSPKLSNGSYVGPPGGCVRLCAAAWMD